MTPNHGKHFDKDPMVKCGLEGCWMTLRDVLIIPLGQRDNVTSWYVCPSETGAEADFSFR